MINDFRPELENMDDHFIQLQPYKGYKAVHRRGKASNYVYYSHHDPATSYEVNRVYKVKGEAKLCENGFHACEMMLLCFARNNGYTYLKDCVLEVELYGQFDTDGEKTCATEMKVLRVVARREVVAAVGGERTWVSNKNVQYWCTDGRLHREAPLPAVVGPNIRMWYTDGILVAKEKGAGDRWEYDASGYLRHARCGGVEEWFDEEGLLHSFQDRPAFICPEYCEWYTHGVLDRGGDQPAVVYFSTGDKYWVVRGVFHREDGKPAVEHGDGTREYYYFGVLHNTDMPAYTTPTGDEEWYNFGSRIDPGGPTLDSDGSGPPLFALST
jgi:hypothetical protein